jgi:predicted nucleotidyltransferase
MRDQAIELLRDGGVLAAWVFGSRAAGTARPDSDIDVAVLVEPPLPLLPRERLARLLEPALGAPVDLVDFLTAPLPLQARVVRTGTLLFSDDEPRRVAEVVRVQGMWPDVQRSLLEMDRAFLARVAAGGLGDG